MFSVSSSKVQEGEIVEVRWQCDNATQVQLTIDSGYRSSTLPLDSMGTKKFRLNRSKRHTRLILSWVADGKSHTATEKVRVVPMPVTNAEHVDDQGRSLDGIAGWWRRTRQNIASWLRNIGSNHNSGMPEKRLALHTSIMLAVVIALSIIFPALTQMLLLIVIVYLMLIYFRKS